MKKIIFISIVCFLSYQMIYAQKIGIHTGSGYKMYDYDIENYEQSSAVPYFARVSVQLGVLEVGGEFSGDGAPLTFHFPDLNTEDERFEEKHKQTYYGGFIGINTATKRTVGLLLRAGAGMNNMTRQIVLAHGGEYESKKLDGVLELRGQAGLFIPIAGKVNITLEFLYSMMERNISDFAADLRSPESDKFVISSMGGLMGITVKL